VDVETIRALWLRAQMFARLPEAAASTRPPVQPGGQDFLPALRQPDDPDLDQPHIWFERCAVCGGSFLDAGEFRDVKHHTIVDFLKDLLAKERV
jgi:hypothetical protein